METASSGKGSEKEGIFYSQTKRDDVTKGEMPNMSRQIIPVGLDGYRDFVLFKCTFYTLFLL